MTETSQNDVNAKLEPLLRQVYGPTVAADLLARIAGLIERWRPRMALRRPWLDQGDAMLITYADTLQASGQSSGQASGESPLATLHRFLVSRARDRLGAVHLLPFFPSTSDDGFSVVDYRAVDPAIGDWTDVAALGRDFELMLDAVINHASAESGWFLAFRRGEAPFRDWFIRAETDADYTSVIRPRALPLLTEARTVDGPVHVWTTFSADQVDLNFAEPTLLVEILDILLDYCAKGARFIRLDAIGFLWKRLGTGCMHLPETHALVRVMRHVVEAAAPGTLVITETNVPHAENIAYLGRGGDEAHLVYQFPLPPLVQLAFQTGDASALTSWARDLEAPPPGTTFLNFLASHDGIGVRPLEGVVPQVAVDGMAATIVERGGAVSMRNMPDGTQRPYELNISYIDGLVPTEADDAMRAAAMRAAHAILLALQGLPAIYIHSLLGSRSDRAGMERTGRNRSINRAKLNVAGVEAGLDDEASLRHRVFAGIGELLLARKREPGFHPDAAQRVLAADPGLVVIERRTADGRVLLAAVNVTPGSRRLALPEGSRWRCILDGESRGGGALELAGFEVRWLVADEGG